MPSAVSVDSGAVGYMHFNVQVKGALSSIDADLLSSSFSAWEDKGSCPLCQRKDQYWCCAAQAVSWCRYTDRLVLWQ